MLTKAIACAVALLAASPAVAQPAERDIYGHLYCNNDGADLRETGDGGYKVDLVFESHGDAEHAVYPAGGATLFGPQATLKSYVSINYEFLLDAQGMPRGRPEPVRVSVSTGRFAGPRLEPLQSLTLRLKAGDTLSPPIAINSAGFGIAVVNGEIGPTGSDNPYDSEMAQSDLDELVLAYESHARWVLLSQNGREVARIPVPAVDVVPERDKNIAWVRKTVPLLAKGRCD